MVLVNLACGLAGAGSAPDGTLASRDYHLETVLVADGQARAVIVIPRGRPVYQELARQIADDVRRLGRVEIPIEFAEEARAADLLGRTNVIVLGNLATNPFIESLYWQWYTLLDLWYPGPGGYVLRTLHDPFGTGRNVILVGGSDDGGVGQATEVFRRTLAATGTKTGDAAPPPGERLAVGRLMSIRLGAGHQATGTGTTWIDPRLRVFREDRELAYGYTAASRAGLIYHYCGDERFARKFRDLVLGTDVLTATNHYNAHMHAIVWDLIEESPVFSDDDRRAITARLLAHARGPDGSGGVGKLTSYPVHESLLDRHTSMQAICTLTESRYFDKYWPAPEWKRNLDAVRTYYDRQMVTGKADSDLGGRGIYSYFECALIPALLLGDRRFIESGALRHFGELCLMHCDNTGYMPDTGQNSADSYPSAALAKCAALLNDGGFLATTALREQAERTGRFTNTLLDFSSGQAWATCVAPEPMAKMIGVYHLPLTRWEHKVRGGTVPIEKTFDKLTMRIGFGPDDQYLLLDGLHGGPAGKPWPDLNSIAHFGQGGRTFLVSDIGGENPANHNVVTVARQGLGEMPADRAASLEAMADLPRLGYSHTRVARYSFSAWDRHILWRKGGWFFVYDRLTMREPGTYSFECHWRTLGEPSLGEPSRADGLIESSLWDLAQPSGSRDVLRIRNAERRPIRYSEQVSGPFGPPQSKAWERYCPRKTINRFRQTAHRTMAAGEQESFANLVYVGGERTGKDYGIRRLEEGIWLLTGSERAYLAICPGGVFERGGVRLQARAACLSDTSMSVVGMTRLEWAGHSLDFSDPVNLECDLASGRCVSDRNSSREVKVEGLASLLTAQLDRDCSLSPDLPAPDATAASRPVELEEIRPAWSFDAGSAVTCLHSVGLTDPGRSSILVGLADGRLCCLDATGARQWERRLGGAIRALADATFPAGPTVLAGCDDEHVYAISADGQELRWKHKCEVPADRFKAYPWWTTEGKAKVRSILTADLNGDGESEVFCGTGGGCVECLAHDGVRRWIAPIEWGIPDRFAVAPMPNGLKHLLVSNGEQSCGGTTWRFGPDGKLISGNTFVTGRSTWDMASVPILELADLDADGKLEAIIGRKGAYNELAVHDSASGQKRWLQTLADVPEAVDTWDVNGDGVMEVVVASGAPWLCIFDKNGKLIRSAVTSQEVLAIACGAQRMLAACADGSVYRLDASGVIRGRCALRGLPLGRFVRIAGLVIAADSSGQVTAMREE